MSRKPIFQGTENKYQSTASSNLTGRIANTQAALMKKTEMDLLNYNKPPSPFNSILTQELPSQQTSSTTSLRQSETSSTSDIVRAVKDALQSDPSIKRLINQQIQQEMNSSKQDKLEDVMKQIAQMKVAINELKSSNHSDFINNLHEKVLKQTHQLEESFTNKIQDVANELMSHQENLMTKNQEDLQKLKSETDILRSKLLKTDTRVDSLHDQYLNNFEQCQERIDTTNTILNESDRLFKNELKTLTAANQQQLKVLNEQFELRIKEFGIQENSNNSNNSNDKQSVDMRLSINDIQSQLSSFPNKFDDIQVKLDQMFALYKYNSKEIVQFKEQYKNQTDQLESLEAFKINQTELSKQLQEQINSNIYTFYHKELISYNTKEEIQKLKDKFDQLERKFRNFSEDFKIINEQKANVTEKQGTISIEFDDKQLNPIPEDEFENTNTTSQNPFEESDVVTYHLDELGFLMDDLGNYILEENGQMIQLTERQIEVLKESQAQN